MPGRFRYFCSFFCLFPVYRRTETKQHKLASFGTRAVEMNRKASFVIDAAAVTAGAIIIEWRMVCLIVPRHMDIKFNLNLCNASISVFDG